MNKACLDANPSLGAPSVGRIDAVVLLRILAVLPRDGQTGSGQIVDELGAGDILRRVALLDPGDDARQDVGLGREGGAVGAGGRLADLPGAGAAAAVVGAADAEEAVEGVELGGGQIHRP